MEEIIEKWRDIPSYEGMYQASSLGRIRSLDRFVPHKRYGTVMIKGCMMKFKKKRYLLVSLSRQQKKTWFTVHSLVAQAFLNHIPDRGETHIDHINNDPHDNRVENLQLLSREEHQIKTSKDNNTSSKYIGVFWRTSHSKWQAQIKIKQKNYYLGLYETEEVAYEAYKIAKSMRDEIPEMGLKRIKEYIKGILYDKN